ncbi:Sodium/glutamate symporter [bioreactor metagenome]|uniref:Sodium/glutamate symporter n=2 Tax=root TaxID=1 RepID=A0A645D977_9ZZZZ
MIISVLLRNVNDKINFVNFDFNVIELLSEISLGLFLTMALMSIDLFKLSSLFGPIVLIVISQAIFIVLFSVFIVFKALGKNLDAAIMISGIIGHCLGATPNALANMHSVSGSYGYSEKAFIVVPLVAAFLLDIFTMPSIIFFINILS